MSESEYGPRGNVIWVKTYDVTIDAVIALPVRGDGPVLTALGKSAWQVTDAEGAQINARLTHEGREVREYVSRRVDDRWKALKSQGYAE